MMKYVLKTILFILIVSSCIESHSTKWTGKERSEFKEMCSSKDYFKVNPMCFIGFEYEEIETIKIIEKENSETLKSFLIRPRKNRDKFDEEHQKYWCSPRIQFKVSNKYEFYLGEGEPYILDSMEMIMWSQTTNRGEGWGCEMGNYTIDDKRYKMSPNICFTKRGFKQKTILN